MKTPNKRRKLLMILGCCCILAAAALFGYNAWVSAKAAAESDRLAALLEQSASSETETKDPGLTDQSDAERLDTVSVENYDLIGVLSMDTINIELPVISQWSYPNLKAAPCRYSGTPDGQMILLAHNYARHFGHIKQLKIGDAVLFTDVKGQKYHYKVSKVETIDGYSLEQIVSGSDWDLTLFTCTYGGKQRVVVRCVKA